MYKFAGMEYIERHIEAEIRAAIGQVPVTVLLGPRQVGKTTLVRHLLGSLPKPSHYLDLELPSDARKLVDPEIYFKQFEGQTVVVDEVQRMPQLFPLFRALIDQKREAGRFVLLGSASPELLLKSAESLAGRVEYHYLAPFLLKETGTGELQRLWFRGGFPNAFLTESDPLAQRWLDSFIQTYAERDLPLMGLASPPAQTLNLLRVLASMQGQLLNMSALSAALGISGAALGRYVDFLQHAFLVRRLPPFHTKASKRMVKTPKVYLRDAGLLHTLLEIPSFEKLVGHIAVGQSWEGFVVEQVLAMVGNRFSASFYRTADGSEMDLVLSKGMDTVAAIEIKYSNSPNLTKGFWNAAADLGARHTFVVTPGSDNYRIQQGVEVVSLADLLGRLDAIV